MKRILVILLLIVLPVVAQALEREKLNSMLAAAAGAQSNAYLEARQAILDLGSDVLSALAQAAVDPALTWQQRLVARISYERIARGDDLKRWGEHDWMKDPEFDPAYLKPIVGPAFPMGKLVVSRSCEMGLWYHYVEIHWKNTQEYSIPSPHSSYWQKCWTHHLLATLADQPERFYLVRALIERLQQDSTLAVSRTQDYYRYLLQHKDADAVPILVERYDAYFKHEVNGPEVFPGSYQITYRGMFTRILSFADSRHAEMLEKFIAERPVLGPLKGQVAEIRKRPAPPPRVEPPFRLGQERVKP